jgi:uncharacterized FlaG/YvyC family protein
MDTGSVTRLSAVSLQAPVRVEAAQVRVAVRTELPPEQAVTAVADTQTSLGADDAAGQRAAFAAKLNAEVDRRIRREIEKQIVADEASGQMVYQTLDADTGKVVNQFPDEAALRAMAYRRSLREADLTPERTAVKI